MVVAAEMLSVLAACTEGSAVLTEKQLSLYISYRGSGHKGSSKLRNYNK